jgi:hypothetical protein
LVEAMVFKTGNKIKGKNRQQKIFSMNIPFLSINLNWGILGFIDNKQGFIE